MSALSVMSLIAPTAPVGANAASVDTAADEALFAGLVAAVAPSLKASGEDGAPLPDAAPAESDTAVTPVPDLGAEPAPAWLPVPLIAPAPLPVAPATPPAAVAGNELPAPGEAPADAPASPVTPAPLLDAAAEAPLSNAPKTAPAGNVPARAAAALPTPEAAPSSDTTQQTLDTVKTPAAAPVAVSPQTAPVETRSGQPLAQPSTAAPPQGDRQPVTTVAEGLPATVQATPQGAAPARLAVSTAPVASTAFATTSAADDATIEPRAEAASVARATSSAQTPAVMTASSIPTVPSTATATRTIPEAAPVQLLADEPVVQTTPTAPAEPSTPVAAPASRPTATVAPQPAAPSTSQPVQSAPSDDTPDAAELATAPAAVSSDAEPETAPQPPPPTAAPAPAPTRNGSARLDERRSNATTANVEAKADTATGARSILPTSSVAAPAATTATALSDAAAPAPVLPADAAPLDAQPDLAPSQQALDARNAAPTAHRDLGLSQLSRATVETTAQLAAQIIKKLEGRSTRFDMALTPEGLGRVDVSLEIDADGRLAARLAFDNPAAATDMRARADELRRQLQDAGFQLTRDSLEFSDRNPSSGFNGGGAFDRAPDRRAFAGAARLAAQADTALPPPGPWASLSLAPDRVDMKV
jgi:hypothetical protein